MSDDKLQKLLNQQRELDTQLSKECGFRAPHTIAEHNQFARNEWGNNLSNAMLDEVQEYRDEFHWKWWTPAESINEEKAKGELIDILHFWLEACNMHDMDADEIMEIYMEKNKENLERQQSGGRYHQSSFDSAEQLDSDEQSSSAEQH